MDWRPPIQIDLYLTAAGESPFDGWLNGLRDRVGRAKIRVQIDRLALGNPGKNRFLKGGVGELRIEYGPGYRVYFARLSSSAVLLLCGGDKSTQHSDLARAYENWADFQERLHGKST